MKVQINPTNNNAEYIEGKIRLAYYNSQPITIDVLKYRFEMNGLTCHVKESVRNGLEYDMYIVTDCKELNVMIDYIVRMCKNAY